MIRKAKKTVLQAFLAVFFLLPLTAAADGSASIRVTPAPGLYASAVTVTADIPSGNALLFVSVNGGDFVPSDGTVEC
ncbi:MAG: hypothetical protein LBR47_05210, partial [Spirochaetaceae bacterium]|nr:hypothetical protein [Spirochaetaceae bacterium]